MSTQQNLPINIPHARTVAGRIAVRLLQTISAHSRCESLKIAQQIVTMLAPYQGGDDPAPAERMVVQAYTLDLARRMVDAMVAEGIGNDRLGHCVRNLFECLGRTTEGSEMGLKTGEIQIVNRH